MPSKFGILHSAIELLKFRCMPSNCWNFSFWPPGLEIRCHLPLSFWNFVEWPWLFFSLFSFPSLFLSVSVIFCPPSDAASSAFSDVQPLSPFLCGVVSLLPPLELYFSSLPHTSSCSNSSLWSTRATMILAIGHLLLAASGLGYPVEAMGELRAGLSLPASRGRMPASYWTVCRLYRTSVVSIRRSVVSIHSLLAVSAISAASGCLCPWPG